MQSFCTLSYLLDFQILKLTSKMFKPTKPLLLSLLIFYPALLIAQNDTTIAIENTFEKIDGFYENGSYDSILLYAQQSLPLAKEVNDKDRILLDIGNAFFYLEKYKNALGYYQKRLDYLLATTPDANEKIGDCYYFLACCHYELNNLDRALKAYKQSLTLTEVTTFPISFALTLSAMAGIYSERSDYDNAILYEQQALKIFTTDGTDEDLFKSNNSLAFYHYFKQNYQQAAQFAERAILFLEKEKSTDASAYNNYGLILIQTGDFERAAFYLQKALTSNESAFSAITRFNQAFLAYKTQAYQKALNDFEEVINIYQEKYPKGHTNIGKAWYYIGEIKAKSGQPKMALKAYQNALQSLVPDFTNDDFDSNPNLEQYCRSHRNLLRILMAKASVLSTTYLTATQANEEKIAFVFDTYQLAIEIAETLRRSYRAEGSKYFLAEETTTLFEEAIHFSYQLYQQTGEQKYLEKMLFYLEKQQAPILLENHSLSTEEVLGGVPTSLIQTEKQLAVDLTFYKNQLALAKENGDEKKELDYSNYLLKGKQQLDSLQDNLQIQYPQYYAAQYSTKPVNLATLQTTLSSDQLLLQYFSTEKSTYTLAITQQAVEVFVTETKPIQKATDNLLISLQNPLTKTLSNQAAFETMTSAAFQLYEQLVQPALTKLSFSPSRLVLINTGFLAAIPFEVLLTDRSTANQFDYLSLDYLLKDYAISYQPSASLFQRLGEQKNGTAAKKILAVAPFANTTSPIAQAMTRSGLGNLPYSKKEVIALAQLFETTTLYEEAAQKSTFLDMAPEYQILHLATHGVADFQNSTNAHLLFYPKHSEMDTSDILYSYEIQNLQLQADLVVLSACETGAGKIDKGEGVLNLARSFFYTGVPSVIMSKWKINDQSSSFIMEALYKNLKTATSKDKALQLAKIDYLEKEADLVTAHPFYWAGLVQLGNASPLDSGNAYLPYLLGFGVLIGLFLFFRFR